MEEGEYHRLAEATLRDIEDRLERVGADLDYQLVSGGILEIEFDDGSKIVINKQAASQELWVAARSGGFHFRRVDAGWQDSRSGEDLYAALSRLVSQQAGETVELTKA
jgi:iron-sulfur cluster assembly protein CyaY